MQYKLTIDGDNDISFYMLISNLATIYSQ